MATRQTVQTESAPQAIGPYSQAIIANNLVFCSGQVGIDPATGQLVQGDVAAQTAQALRNLQAVLETAGTTLDMCVKCTVFLKSMSDFETMNRVYDEFFGDQPPARSTVAVADLPRSALVEIEAIAVVLSPT